MNGTMQWRGFSSHTRSAALNAAGPLDKNSRAALGIPARARDASDASRMSWAHPNIPSALDKVGMSSAGVRVSVTQAAESSLGSIGRIIGQAPTLKPLEIRAAICRFAALYGFTTRSPTRMTFVASMISP
jgi:hypothetical protein